MPILSDVDIKKQLGKEILIYPFNSKNIRGASINLSTSNRAWSLKKKKSIFNKSSNTIDIPAHDTALIETEEVLHVSKKIAGSFHSKVGIVAKGLGHVGTTLDPGWIGNLLITIHNHSDEIVRLQLNETFISIMFQYVSSESEFVNDNKHGRPELLKNFELTPEDEKYFHDDLIRTNIVTLKETMHSHKPFKEFQLKIFEEYKKKNKVILFFKSPLFIASVLFVVFLACFIYVIHQKIITNSNLITVISSLLTGYISVIITTLLIKRKTMHNNVSYVIGRTGVN